MFNRFETDHPAGPYQEFGPAIQFDLEPIILETGETIAAPIIQSPPGSIGITHLRNELQDFIRRSHERSSHNFRRKLSRKIISSLFEDGIIHTLNEHPYTVLNYPQSNPTRTFPTLYLNPDTVSAIIKTPFEQVADLTDLEPDSWTLLQDAITNIINQPDTPPTSHRIHMLTGLEKGTIQDEFELQDGEVWLSDILNQIESTHRLPARYVNPFKRNMFNFPTDWIAEVKVRDTQQNDFYFTRVAVENFINNPAESLAAELWKIRNAGPVVFEHFQRALIEVVQRQTEE